jgi:hypothetical protein
MEVFSGPFCDTTGLSSFSDVAALMVFDHQMYMTNLITRTGWEVRAAEYDGRNGRSVDLPSLVRETAQEFVDYLLFVDEAPLLAPIRSSLNEEGSRFAKKFAFHGPHDREGRSLRDLDLQTRLLRYPRSYMIYSDPSTRSPHPQEARSTRGCGRCSQAKLRTRSMPASALPIGERSSRF